MIAALLLLVWAGRATGAEPASTVDRITLGGHRFQVPSNVYSPFTATRFGFRQGVSYLAVPDVQPEGYDESFDLGLFGAAESLDLGVPLAPRWGLYSRAVLLATSGANADSAYFMGARLGANWELGGTLVAMRQPAHGRQLALRVLVRGRVDSTLQPAGLVDALVDDREDTLRDVLRGDYLEYILTSERGASPGAGLAFAQALSPGWGLQASTGLRVGRTSRDFFDGVKQILDVRTRLTGSMGLAVDHTFEPPVPLSVQLEYRYRVDVDGDNPEVSAVEGQTTQRHFVGLGCYYVGRPDLDLGIAASTLLVFSADQERYLSGELVIRNWF